MCQGSENAGRLIPNVHYRYDAIRTGEPAEVLVLSKSRAFESFKVEHSVPEICLHVLLRYIAAQAKDIELQHCSARIIYLSMPMITVSIAAEGQLLQPMFSRKHLVHPPVAQECTGLS